MYIRKRKKYNFGGPYKRPINDELYNSARANELGYTPDETGHLPSVDSETGMWLKSKEHPTAWMELLDFSLNPELQKEFNHPVINEEGYFGKNQLQYKRPQNSLVEPPVLLDDDIIHFSDNPYEPGVNKDILDSEYRNFLSGERDFIIKTGMSPQEYYNEYPDENTFYKKTFDPKNAFGKVLMEYGGKIKYPDGGRIYANKQGVIMGPVENPDGTYTLPQNQRGEPVVNFPEVEITPDSSRPTYASPGRYGTDLVKGVTEPVLDFLFSNQEYTPTINERTGLPYEASGRADATELPFEIGSNILRKPLKKGIEKASKSIDNLLPEYKTIYRVEPTDFKKDPLDELSGRWFSESKDDPFFYSKNLKSKNPDAQVRLLTKKINTKKLNDYIGDSMPEKAKRMSIGTGNYKNIDDLDLEISNYGFDPFTIENFQQSLKTKNNLLSEKDIIKLSNNPRLFNYQEAILDELDVDKIRTLNKNNFFSSNKKYEFSKDEVYDNLSKIYEKQDRNILGIPRNKLPFKYGGNINNTMKKKKKYFTGGNITKPVSDLKNPFENSLQDLIINGNKIEYKVGGKILKQVAAGAYGVGEGILDTVTMGATDQLTDKGFEALTKAGNKNIDLSNPDDVKFLKNQQKVKGYTNTAGAVGAGIYTGNVQGAIKQGTKGLNTAFQATDGLSDDFKQVSQGVTGIAGVASGFAGGLNSDSFNADAIAGNGAAGFGKQVGKFSPLGNQAMGMIGGNQQPLWQQGDVMQEIANNKSKFNQANYSQGSLTYAQGGEIVDIEGGGTHEENKYGGVPVGPNALLEQDEKLVDGDFVLSNRLGDENGTFAEQLTKEENRGSKMRDNKTDKFSKWRIKNKKDKLVALNQAALEDINSIFEADTFNDIAAYGGKMKKKYFSGGGDIFNTNNLMTAAQIAPDVRNLFIKEPPVPQSNMLSLERFNPARAINEVQRNNRQTTAFAMDKLSNMGTSQNQVASRVSALAPIMSEKAGKEISAITGAYDDKNVGLSNQEFLTNLGLQDQNNLRKFDQKINKMYRKDTALKGIANKTALGYRDEQSRKMEKMKMFMGAMGKENVDPETITKWMENYPEWLEEMNKYLQ
jgi:hypothetical protein